MDRSWMFLRHRFQPKFTQGLQTFINVAKEHLNHENKTRCPCLKCQNGEYFTLKEIHSHIMVNGFARHYTIWTEHGEDVNDVVNDQIEDEIVSDGEGDEDDNALMFDMLNDVQGPINMEMEDEEASDKDMSNDANKYDYLFGEAQRELYPGCKKFSALSFILKLMHVKVLGRWSNKSFNILLKMLKDSHPEGATIPESHYEAKKMLRELGLGYESIHACKNDCALFWKENEKLDKCPECNELRYKSNDGKRKKVPQKVLRYFPLKPRLKRLFMSRHTATDMKWHKRKRQNEEGFLRHPADSEEWKKFDEEYPHFAADSRNVRLGLATDGFNPFGNMSTSYSMWPVMLVPYNLPPWKCMKGMFSMMSLLIPGPRAPGKDIDVYLRPLIDELKELWEVGVEAFDVSVGRNFTLRACVLWTINDFPAYGNLSGWSTKGYKACPVCNEDITSTGLRGKICYMGHRRFLPHDHEWRRSEDFNGLIEDRPPPRFFCGDDIVMQLDRVYKAKPGKHPSNPDLRRQREPHELNWTKKSIFFELEYWSKLRLRHNIDVMHVEKNICDSVIGTLLDIAGKTKDTKKARLDLADIKIRKGLHLKRQGNKLKKPHARYVLKLEYRRLLCKFLKFVKYPDGYAANICKNVNIIDGKIHGLKSHDCHVLLQRLLPVGIRPYLDKDVCTAIIELSIFFQQICAKTLRVSDLQRMEKEIVIILCKLERIFPPAFFDIMVHLAVHLPREAILGGPVTFRWMYPIERNLGTYKKYVTNKARPEGSIAEAYIVNEAITFCSMYFREIETRFNQDERNIDVEHNQVDGGLSVFSQRVRPFSGKKYVMLDRKEVDKAHWYVLYNCDEVQPYLNEHEDELKRTSNANLYTRQEKEFPTWFEKRMTNMLESGLVDATDKLYCLACKPDVRVHTYTGCIVDGVRFHTKELDDHRTTQNSGVYVPGVFTGGSHDYYGVLLSVVKLTYLDMNQVFLFKCKWFNTDETSRDLNRRMIRHDYNLTSINTSSTWYEDEPFILSNEAQQVFYLDDDKLGSSWKVVQKIQLRHVWDVPEVEDEDVDEDYLDLVANDAYQQDEFNNIQWFVQEESLENPHLHRDDIEPEVIASNVVSNQWMEEGGLNDFMCDEIEEEDDSHDGDEEEAISTDEDSD